MFPLPYSTHLADSTVQKPPVSSASSPGPPPGFRGSYRGSTWALSGGFLAQECKRSHDAAATCWCVSGAGWPGSSHGWSPAAPWPVIWGRRWTAAWPVGCSPAPPGASPALKNTGNQEKCWLNFCQTFFLKHWAVWKNSTSVTNSCLRGDTLLTLTPEPTVPRLAAAVSHGGGLISAPPAVALWHTQRN